MNEIVKEWVDKAERDYRSARRELGVTEERNNDLICFLSQQSVEKLMKAVLVQKEVLVPKVHDLLALDQKLREIYPLWNWNSFELKELSNAAVEFRYPGMSATDDIADRLFKFSTAIRKELLGLLKQ